MKNYPLLIAIDGKGFDHQIVTAIDRNEVARVFAWESDSFEMAKVLAASTAMLTACEFYVGTLHELEQGGYRIAGWELEAYRKFKAAIAEAKGKRP
jgi:hypothetical protein